MLRGIGANVTRLRSEYRDRFSREWPHDDEYLRRLTQESATVEDCLMRMCDTDQREISHG